MDNLVDLDNEVLLSESEGVGKLEFRLRSFWVCCIFKNSEISAGYRLQVALIL